MNLGFGVKPMVSLSKTIVLDQKHWKTKAKYSFQQNVEKTYTKQLFLIKNI